MDFTVSVLADRPDLTDALWGMADSWPTFMTHDPVAAMYYNPEVIELFADYILVCQDTTGTVVGKAYSIPFQLPEGSDLPIDGWDGAIHRGIGTRLTSNTPTIVSALEIAVTPEAQGKGLSSKLLVALRDNAHRLGFEELIAPLRPNTKTDIDEPMSTYAYRTRSDGLPVDPWLRVHIRAGGRIDSIASRSMVIPGTLDEWRTWTGLPFDTTDPVEVPGALAPVHCDLTHGTAVYTEPNIWVRHRTAR